ncbi:uncharacterized protein LOC133206039 [Saccostrea echinata]|uniref:uncharacterized protein LOC133206039 n=1 Tax=Saccostrea echinata TaxID=191078 RepID=UPI002A80ECAA|nr:uncharacterized protein LOC133206039 [Saccostrea echinata]
MTSSFQASKQLLAIREQLKQIDKQYKEGFKFENSKDSLDLEKKNETRTHETISNDISLDHNQTNTSIFEIQTEEPNISQANNFEHIEAMFSTLIEDSQDNYQHLHDLPLSEELRHAITNMEDIDDVDTLIGDVISSVQIDPVSDEDLDSIEHFVSCSESHQIEEGNPRSLDRQSKIDLSIPKQYESQEEKALWRKERIKKDNHNIIERRRRYNINDRIKELATLLPSSTHPSMKLNKGSILKASVEYVKMLKKDREKLTQYEAHQKAMEKKYHKMLIRIFQLELKMKLYGLTEQLDCMQVKKKKRPRRRLSEIDAMIEDLMMPRVSTNIKANPFTEDSLFNEEAKPKVFGSDKNTKHATTKSGLKERIMKKLCKETIDPCKVKLFNLKERQELHTSCGEQDRREKVQSLVQLQNDRSQAEAFKQDETSAEATEEKYISKLQPETIQLVQNPLISENSDLSLEKCNLFLDLFGNQATSNITVVQIDPNMAVPSTPVQQLEPMKEDVCISPVTSTTNMLEALLRNSDEASSVYSSLENSLETSI